MTLLLCHKSPIYGTNPITCQHSLRASGAGSLGGVEEAELEEEGEALVGVVEVDRGQLAELLEAVAVGVVVDADGAGGGEDVAEGFEVGAQGGDVVGAVG